MSTPMEFLADEGDDGTRDWPSRRNREVQDASFSSSDDEGGVREYAASLVHVGNINTIMGGGAQAKLGARCIYGKPARSTCMQITTFTKFITRHGWPEIKTWIVTT
jgi:hypothetical protein